MDGNAVKVPSPAIYSELAPSNVNANVPDVVIGEPEIDIASPSIEAATLVTVPPVDGS